MKKTSKLLAILLSAATIAGTGIGCTGNVQVKSAPLRSLFSVGTVIPEEDKLREIEKKPYYGMKFEPSFSLNSGRRMDYNFENKLSPSGKSYVCIDKAKEYAEHLNKKGIPAIVTRFEIKDSLYKYHAVVEAYVKDPKTGKYDWRMYDPTSSDNIDGLVVDRAYESERNPTHYLDTPSKRWVDVSGTDLLEKNRKNKARIFEISNSISSNEK